jgi:RHS repeat-associated protein
VGGKTYSYDGNGNRTRLTDPNGDITTYSYDDNSRLTEVNAPAGITTYQYDSLGRQTEVNLPNGTYTQYSYDPNRNWLVSLVNKDSTNEVLSSYSYTYDSVGNRLSVTEADDSNVTYAYEDIYQLTGETRIGTNAYTITYQYDSVGNRTQMVKNAIITGYTYNTNNQLTAETAGDLITGIGCWKLDDNEPNTTVTDSSGNGFNGTAQQNTEDLSTTGKIGGALTFNGSSDYVEVDNSSAFEFSQYDSFTISFWAKPTSTGWVICKMRDNAQWYNFGYEVKWDSTNSRYGFIAESSRYGQTIVYTDNDSAPSGVWHHVTAVYDNKAMKIYLDGYLHDSATFAYNTGSTVPQKDLVIGARSYDSTVTSFFGGSIDEVRIFDRALTDEEIESLSSVTSVSSVAYSYDDNGNLVSKTDSNDANNNATYTWDSLNRLIGVSEADGNTVYAYNGDGTRISKTQDGTKTKYINDVGLSLVQVLMETNDANQVQATYTYGNDLISMDRAGTNTYYNYDGLGSVRQLTDSSGAVAAAYIYDSFGNVIAQTVGGGMAYNRSDENKPINKAGVTLLAFLGLGLGVVTIRNRKHGLIILLCILLCFAEPVQTSAAIVEPDATGNPYGFTGEQQFGEANSLIFLRARYYDPSIGRFINRDPILAPIQVKGRMVWVMPYLTHYPRYLTSYVYATNNPVNSVDPSGYGVWRCIKRTLKENGIAVGLDILALWLTCMYKCVGITVNPAACALGCAIAVLGGTLAGLIIGCLGIEPPPPDPCP